MDGAFAGRLLFDLTPEIQSDASNEPRLAKEDASGAGGAGS